MLSEAHWTGLVPGSLGSLSRWSMEWHTHKNIWGGRDRITWERKLAMDPCESLSFLLRVALIDLHPGHFSALCLQQPWGMKWCIFLEQRTGLPIACYKRDWLTKFSTFLSVPWYPTHKRDRLSSEFPNCMLSAIWAPPCLPHETWEVRRNWKHDAYAACCNE